VALASLVAALWAGLAACNSVLGISAAQPEPGDAASTANSYTLSCANYCDLMAANCVASGTQDNTEYLSQTVCSQICPQFESTPVPGNVVPENVSSPPMTPDLDCRIWHANAAGLDPHTHCPHAGPLGGKMCGSDPCVEFCALDLAFCQGDAAAYPSLSNCMSACEPDGGYAGYNYMNDPANFEVSDLDMSGDTLNCRMYHLENFIYTGDPVHCMHSSQSGGGVCVDSP
jgi:hypothetical protein